MLLYSWQGIKANSGRADLLYVCGRGFHSKASLATNGFVRLNRHSGYHAASLVCNPGPILERCASRSCVFPPIPDASHRARSLLQNG